MWLWLLWMSKRSVLTPVSWRVWLNSWKAVYCTIQPSCRPARDQIPSGTCRVLLQTGRHNPLTDTVVPLVLCVHVSVSLVQKSGESATASLVCFVHPVQMHQFCPVPPSLLYLVSVIQATSWSWAGLISFTHGEELVCGQTAHYGDDPAALQVTN